MAKKKYVVAHKSLYLRVNGKLQEMEEGSSVSLDPEQAKKMLESGMIKDPSDKASVTPGGSGANGAASDKGASE